MTRGRLAVTLAALVAAAPAIASAAGTPASKPAAKGTKARTSPVRAPKPAAPHHDAAHPQVAFDDAGVLRPARETIGRREAPAGAAEDAAQQIEKLLRGPLRGGVTGIFVADARTGEPLFAVNADDALNPASNVKMISTAAALELLGADYHYATRLLGPAPDKTGTIHGDVYLLGTYDPTLAFHDLDDLAVQLAAHGVHALTGDVLVGADPTRDGIFHASVPIEIAAGAAGEAPTVTPPPGFDLVSLTVTATTSKRARDAGKVRLRYQAATTHDAAGHPHIALTVSGSIGTGAHATYQLPTEEHTATAAYALRGALRAHDITVAGDIKTAELADYTATTIAAGQLPDELARHDSKSLAAIVANVNKYSINWLADRVIMTAAALSHHSAPSMPLALDAMYGWLARHPHLAKQDVLVDTGSGLSYKTQLTPHELVAIVRAAAGFSAGGDDTVAHAWLASLSIAGTDGTLARRFRTSSAKGRIHGKTGTLNSAIALSGVLDLDPARPLAFSIVTNGNAVAKGRVRAAHEQVIAVLCKYLQKTAVVGPPPATAQSATQAQPEPSQPIDATAAHAPATSTTSPAAAPADDVEDGEPDGDAAPAL